jgi:hypothetical protein
MEVPRNMSDLFLSDILDRPGVLIFNGVLVASIPAHCAGRKVETKLNRYRLNKPKT